MKRKTLYLSVILILLMCILGNRYLPKSLEKIVPESLWTETTPCRVIEIDKFDMDKVNLNIGELFQNVKVQGPFREKNSAINYTWIDIRIKTIDTHQSNAYDTLEINVIRENIGKFVYSLNIGTQCYKVIAGKDEIDKFIQQMNELADTLR